MNTLVPSYMLEICCLIIWPWVLLLSHESFTQQLLLPSKDFFCVHKLLVVKHESVWRASIIWNFVQWEERFHFSCFSIHTSLKFIQKKNAKIKWALYFQKYKKTWFSPKIFHFIYFTLYYVAMLFLYYFNLHEHFYN